VRPASLSESSPDRVIALPTDASGLCLSCLAHHFPDLFSHLYENLAGRTLPATGRGDRWSILFSAPMADLCLLPDGRLQTHGLTDAESILSGTPSFLTAFDRWVEQQGRAHDPLFTPDGETVLPFAGGWSFYLGYELVGQIETTLDLPAFMSRSIGDTAADFPVAVAQYHPAAVLFDAVEQRAWLVHDGRHPQLVARLQHAVEASVADATRQSVAEDLTLRSLTVDPPRRYTDGVRRVHDYLLAGDVFQVNLSRRWRFAVEQPDDVRAAGAAIHARLGRHNPAPFSAWYRLAEGQIVSSSPERLVSHQQGHVATRPIAGTRRRDPDPQRDRALIDELRAHPKERAEHVMLIDLERNDLGRVCEPGSIRVDELMVVESFAHVHHLVSNVAGCLRSGRSLGELLAAVFPGGTITGCPKVRCMEILAELEGSGRGPYTGSLGYLSLDGRLDSNILIRTVFLGADGQGEFRTGAGIVVDSDPERERIETEEKARGLLLALGQDPERVAVA